LLEIILIKACNVTAMVMDVVRTSYFTVCYYVYPTFNLFFNTLF